MPLYILDLIGVAVFAASGALAAVRSDGDHDRSAEVSIARHASIER